MKRLVTTAAVMAALWMVAAGHVEATTSKSSHHQSTCSKINAALQSGQSMQSVEKQFKVSRSHVRHCQEQKTASTAPARSTSQTH